MGEWNSLSVVCFSNFPTLLHPSTAYIFLCYVVPALPICRHYRHQKTSPNFTFIVEHTPNMTFEDQDRGDRQRTHKSEWVRKTSQSENELSSGTSVEFMKLVQLLSGEENMIPSGMVGFSRFSGGFYFTVEIVPFSVNWSIILFIPYRLYTHTYYRQHKVSPCTHG